MLLIGAELLRIGKQSLHDKVWARRKHCRNNSQKKHKTTKRRQTRLLFYVKNHCFAKRNHANSKPTARNGGFLLYRKRIIKKKPWRQIIPDNKRLKIIETNIIVHVPCRNIEKKRIIKSAIQKFLSGFIIKHGEK